MSKSLFYTKEGSEKMELQVGMKGIAETVVSEQNTAVAYGSGGVEVFATPAMIGLMEGAACNGVNPYLPEGKSTVGTLVNVSHTAATPKGMKVTAEAELVEIDGKRLVFKVAAYDEKEKIGEGVHERFIITLDRFMEKAQGKIEG